MTAAAEPSPPKSVFSRVRLRRDVPLQALAPVLMPAEANARLAVAHRLMWALFPGSREQDRDFLWREETPGRTLGDRVTFYLLSARPPVDVHTLFEIGSKPFAPELAAGDRLAFALRVNPVVSTRPPGARQRGQRHDPVAARLHGLSRDERGERRHDVIQEVAWDWLTAQGERHGFRLIEPETLRAEDSWRQVPREKGQKPVAFSVLDLEGRLEVADSARFLQALSAGFGKAKAFGCGLMLIRRLRVARP
ncbi:MAG: type I-E CRISPR-associated protein Cas6/Cse3/CasE [Rhodospirillaceae bacterium]